MLLLRDPGQGHASRHVATASHQDIKIYMAGDLEACQLLLMRLCTQSNLIWYMTGCYSVAPCMECNLA